MRIRISIVLAALVLPLMLPGAVGARNASDAYKAEQARITSYWTPARMAAAKSKDYVRDPKSGKMIPYAKPGGGGSVTGASWTADGTIKARSGKLFFSTTGGNWQCSASVVDDGSTSNGYSIILTAGHCTYDAAEGWSTNVQFIPDYDFNPTSCPNTRYGCWTGATKLAVNTAFVTYGGFGDDRAVRVDYGFMRFGPGGKGGTVPPELDAAVGGGYALRTETAVPSDTQWAFGYPAAGKYKGKDLVYCKGSTIDDPYGVGTWGMACNMTGGSSGGPWLWGTADPASTTSPGKLSSLNSYGYSGLTYMFGPRFDGATINVRDDLKAQANSSGNTTLH